MRRLSQALHISFWLLLFSSVAMAQIAVFEGTPPDAGINIILKKNLGTGVKLKASLFTIKEGNRFQIKDFEELSPLPTKPNTFFLKFPATLTPQALADPKAKFELLIFIPTTDTTTGTTANVMSVLAVVRPLKTTIERNLVACKTGISVTAQSAVTGYNWQPVLEWLKPFRPTDKQPGLATIKIKVTGQEPKIFPLSSFIVNENDSIEETRRVNLCLQPKDALPTGNFSVEVQLQGNAPQELAHPLTTSGLSGDTAIGFAKNEEVKEPSKRKLERNFDLGVSFTSSIADITTPATDTAPAITKRVRSNQGVMDVRFAPWLNLWETPFVENQFLWFFTPIYLNANVATGKIVKETLGLNQILLGTEGELRYYKAKTIADVTSPLGERRVNPVTHRLIYGFVHASDRDIKQAEFTGKIEYLPLINALYQPISLNWRADGEGGQIFGRFGYAIKPRVGFELGRTYLRRNPAEAIKPSDAVRRLVFGSDLAIDLTRYLTLSVTDAFYIRYETEENRYRSYVKAQIEGGIGSPNGYRSQSIFLSFERGQQPPFALPNVNVFKAGYRIRANFCGQKCR